jgi:glutaconate CoA-transferase subunit B
MAHCAVQWPNIRFIGFEANEWLHNENRLIAFIGGAQIDPFGNVNSTSIGDYHHPKTRFTGSGGANGIATYCNTIIMMQHEKRRFMQKVDYITSPGWMEGPGGREAHGLPGNRGPQMVVTDRGILKFDKDTKRMYLAGYYPSSSPEEIIENTGFDIDVSKAVKLDAPDPEVIRMIREEIDPGQAFIKVPVEEKA